LVKEYLFHLKTFFLKEDFKKIKPTMFFFRQVLCVPSTLFCFFCILKSFPFIFYQDCLST